MAEITIEPQSLFVAGQVGRRFRWNDFKPALLVEATLDSRSPADTPAIKGKLVLQATDSGCPAAEFDTTRTFWDETFTVRARLRDALLPITVLGWQMELGNFSWTNIGGAHFLDPRPTWSSAPLAITDGELMLSGEVEHLDPLMYPALDGPLVQATVPVEVSGDADNGWHLRLRGIDGNFYVRFSTDVVDGEGKQWHGETFIAHQGDRLQLPPKFNQYKADCDAKYRRWWELRLTSLHLAAVRQVQPGEPVMSGETREAIAIRTLVAAGDPAALQQLIAAAERFGASLYRQVGQVAPAEIEAQRIR